MPKLSKKEMAVAIANDVLAQLRKRKKGYIASAGVYVSSSAFHNEIDHKSTLDLKDHLDEIQEDGCRVCALGAALLSRARLYDNVPFSDFYSKWESDGQSGCHQFLKDVFSHKQLTLIESAFEGADMDYEGDGLSAREVKRVCAYYEKYPDDKARMRAIMTNIVENGGVFKP